MAFLPCVEAAFEVRYVGSPNAGVQSARVGIILQREEATVAKRAIGCAFRVAVCGVSVERLDVFEVFRYLAFRLLANNFCVNGRFSYTFHDQGSVHLLHNQI